MRQGLCHDAVEPRPFPWSLLPLAPGSLQNRLLWLRSAASLHDHRQHVIGERVCPRSGACASSPCTPSLVTGSLPVSYTVPRSFCPCLPQVGLFWQVSRRGCQVAYLLERPSLTTHCCGNARRPALTPASSCAHTQQVRRVSTGAGSQVKGFSPELIPPPVEGARSSPLPQMFPDEGGRGAWGQAAG